MRTVPQDQPMSDTPVDIVTRQTAPHYGWGAGCDGWHLLRSEGLSVIQERMPAGASEQRHRHRIARQFFFVLRGQLEIEVEGFAHAVPAQAGLEVPPGCAHGVRNGGNGAAEFLVISQPPSHGDRIPAPAPAMLQPGTPLSP